jgi:carbon starvation protein CstA
MKRISQWGIASLLLLLGGFAFGQYNLYLYDHGRTMLLPSWTAVHQVCAVVEFAAVVCGVIAIRRQSPLWLLTVLPAAWMAIVCFLNDL